MLILGSPGFALATALALAASAGCRRPHSGPVSPGPATQTEVSTEGEPPAFPGGFEPGAALGAPAAADLSAAGATYLALIAPRLQPRWHGFLEDCRLRLPPSHALNNSTLAATLRLVIGTNGEIAKVELLTTSGNPDFDAAATEIASDVGSVPPPPRSIVSDDEATYIDWLFARDQRQAGPATATIQRTEWELGRAIPKLLAEANVTEAALRLARSARESGDLLAEPQASRDELVSLTERVMVAAIREGLLSEDLTLQRAAVAAAAQSRTSAVARELRAIADGSLDLSLRSEAIAALGAVGDKGSAALLASIIVRDQGGNAEVSAEAARVLASFGEIDLVADTVAHWLSGREADKQFAALVVASKASIPSLTASLVRLFASVNDRAVRARVCTALGPAAGDGAALRTLVAGLKEGDATVRTACAQAIATAAVGGVRARAAYWAMVEALKDKDDRVRGAGALASAYLNPSKFAAELYRLRRESSAIVLVQLAKALNVVPGREALDRLSSLAKHELPEVRAAATAVLVSRTEPRAKEVARTMAQDPDPRVRLAALGAVDSEAALVGFGTDDSAEVRAEAASRVVVLRGRLGALADVAEALAAAPAGSVARSQYAAAWLQAK